MVPKVTGNYGPPLHIMSTMDWLHIIWRQRRQLLDANRRLDFGGLIISHVDLIKNKDALDLNDSDLDPANKQSYIGALKIFDFKLNQSTGVITEVRD